MNKKTPFFAHPQALLETQNVGEGTRIWAFAHVLPGAVIGADCNICDHVFIENEVKIGNRVTIKCGVQVWDGVTLEDDVFVGPNVTFTNDLFPRSKQYPDKFLPTVIRKGASIGANATLLAGITVENHAMIGAGAVVTKDVPPHAIVVGNPARIVGYSNVPKKEKQRSVSTHQQTQTDVLPDGAKLIELPLIQDLRGTLSFGEIEQHLPFTPVRYFVIADVPSHEVRGEHAHKELHEFLVCIKGSCSVVVDDGYSSVEIQLNRSNLGLHLPPRVWAIQYKYSSDAILLVLASDIYKADDYIRDYNAFLRWIKK